MRGGVEALANLAFNDGAMENVETELMFEKMLGLLTLPEQRLMLGLYRDGKTISQLAEELHVSRKTLYVWRNHIKLKIKPLMG